MCGTTRSPSIGRGEEAPAPPFPVTPRVKKVLKLARQEAKRLHSTHVRSETQAASGSSGRSMSVADEDESATCSFFGKRRADGTRMFSGPGARICTACLTLCQEIEQEERATLNLDRA